MALTNSWMHKAKTAKNDEYFTRLTDIEKELLHYKKQFEGKIVLCNCDDPTKSQFFYFFSRRFRTYKLKKLITTHYTNGSGKQAYALIMDGPDWEKDVHKVPLKGNGSFDSPECIEYLKEADIVSTNPPFSLFRKYLDLLIEYKKKFLIIGNMHAVTYKDVFKHILEHQVWIGYTHQSGVMYFDIDPSRKEEKGVKNDPVTNKYIKGTTAFWYTNMEHSKRNEEIILYRSYRNRKGDPQYAHYDNYPDIINVDKLVNIPMDWRGTMGVPITMLSRYNPKQFEILGCLVSGNERGRINGKLKYARILIKNKHPETCKFPNDLPQ